MKRISILHINQFKHDHQDEDFHVNLLETHLKTRHKDIAEPHSHNFYLAVLFTHGNGRHEIDFTTYNVQPGALFFLNPGQTHHWELSEDVKGYIFFHTRDYYEMYYTHNKLSYFPFFYSMHSNPCIYLDALQLKELTSYFGGIYSEGIKNLPLQKQAVMSFINLVYITCTRLYDSTETAAEPHNDNGYYQKFHQFEALVESHYIEHKLPVYYASQLFITPRHLNRIAQAVTGKTATDVILDRVLLEAKKEIVLRRGNFKSIAEILGYNDYAYFSRMFKLKTGETPGEFARRYINKID
ncbi:AraC family transcriptional regulator [Flavobacterium sp. RHBU_24]|uniref:AraC family transcriptional regulator n=1 Tax=Flavobacterium sp. RHBU_24 TaxID=3391185 RepID=UPI0039849119